MGETMAMALAEVGRFDEAVTVQRVVMTAAGDAGRQDLARSMAANLALYEELRPSRAPFSAGP